MYLEEKKRRGGSQCFPCSQLPAMLSAACRCDKIQKCTMIYRDLFHPLGPSGPTSARPMCRQLLKISKEETLQHTWEHTMVAGQPRAGPSSMCSNPISGQKQRITSVLLTPPLVEQPRIPLAFFAARAHCWCMFE